MTHPSYTEFSAGDSMLGYIYQCEYALYHLLDRDYITTQISIETLDDIVSGDLSDPQALLQLKLHRVNGDGVIRSITDRSPDLWRTLRGWASLIQDERVDPTRTTFFLLTTSPLGSQPSIGHLLGPSDGALLRDINRAKITLERLANEILNDSSLRPEGRLVEGASALLALKPAQRVDLVRNVVIVTGTPPIADLRKNIENRLRASGSIQESHAQFAEMIVGWWYRQCIDHLDARDGRTITFDALERKMAETARIFALPNLPRYEALERPTGADLAGLIGRLFVHQLRALGLPLRNELVKAATIDYYKADGHRKKWLEEFRLDRRELEAFEDDLRNIWAVNFGVAETEVDGCAGCADPERALCQLGIRVLHQTLSARSPSLKGFDGEYLAKGSYHIMANTSAIGWHPHWRTMFPEGDPS